MVEKYHTKNNLFTTVTSSLSHKKKWTLFFTILDRFSGNVKDRMTRSTSKWRSETSAGVNFNDSRYIDGRLSNVVSV